MITRQAFRPLTATASRQWVCPSCSVAIASSFPSRSTRTPQQKRSLYSRPRLNYDESFNKQGVPGLFEKDGFAIGWTQYQNLLITKLNMLTKGNSLEGKDVKELALRFAHNPDTASLFNHASMAHNNHFFYQQFSPAPRQLHQYPDLSDSLIEQFGSMTTFETIFKDTARSMFGGGFVWLIWARGPENATGSRDGSGWRILCTYNAGTPYPEAGFMQQGLDANTTNELSMSQYRQNSLGYAGRFSGGVKEKAKLPPGGTSVMPVMCLSTWEHTYIYDYGLAGKDTYIDRFWDAIDWQVINNRAPPDISVGRFRRAST